MADAIMLRCKKCHEKAAVVAKWMQRPNRWLSRGQWMLVTFCGACGQRVKEESQNGKYAALAGPRPPESPTLNLGDGDTNYA